jgi:hypothetical protein
MFTVMAGLFFSATMNARDKLICDVNLYSKVVLLQLE